MPSVPIAAFLAGALLTLLLPLGAADRARRCGTGVLGARARDGRWTRTRHGPGPANPGPSDPRDAPARARGVMHAGAGTRWPSRPAMLRPARIAGFLVARRRLGLSVGIGVHRLAAGSAATPATVSDPASACTARRPGPKGRVPRRRSTPCATRPGTCSRSARSAGRTVAMTFFDSHCNQACPLEGRALAAAERALPAAQRPVLVVVSVNPRDTPACERAAARKWGLAAASAWHWLSGAPRSSRAVWKAYRIFVAADEGRHRPHRGRCTCSTAAATSARPTCTRSSRAPSATT